MTKSNNIYIINLTKIVNKAKDQQTKMPPPNKTIMYSSMTCKTLLIQFFVCFSRWGITAAKMLQYWVAQVDWFEYGKYSIPKQKTYIVHDYASQI